MKTNKQTRNLSLEDLNEVVGGAWGGDDWKWAPFVPNNIRFDDSAFQFRVGDHVCGNGTIFSRDYVTRDPIRAYQLYTVYFYDSNGNFTEAKKMWQKDIWY